MNPNVPQVAAADAQRPLFFGVDVGGTNTKIGLVDDNGATIDTRKTPTHEERGPADAIQRMAAIYHEMLATHGIQDEDVAAAGLGCPGSMDIPNGLVLAPPNLPHWRHFPIRDALGEAIGKLVGYANDANAAAYGEYWIGSGRNHPNMVMLTLGTGVGGGIIVNNLSIDGTNSFGSECGHIIVDSHEDARLCVWGGGQGQLEAYACAGAVVARTRELLDGGRESSLSARLAAGEELTPLLLYEEAERGDALSLEVILETARYLGIAITTLVHIIDPGLIVIGGAMTFGEHRTAIGRQFLDAIRAEFRRRAFEAVLDGTVIDYASLGGAAGYIGAAGIGRVAFYGRENLKP
ncbi:MAG: ROK family protein [Planctomycetales bacterium]|nr:ROK family protein [Planctomycetales bacterium]